MERRRRPDWRWLLWLGSILAAPADAVAKWHGIDRADNRIVFAGAPTGADSEAHRHLRLEDTDGRRESYEAHWRERGRGLPLLRLRLHLHRQAPEHSFRTARRRSLEHLARTHPLFRGRALTAVEAGTAESVVGPAEYVVFEVERHGCGMFRIYPNRHEDDTADTLGDTLMTGLYCPVSREVDAAELASVVARTGIRDIAVPEANADEGPSARSREDTLTDAVRSGDMKGLRRIAATGLDPDSVIAFSHPRFARGRTIHRPMLMAASLYGHAEMTAFLLDLGAATDGPAAGAICAAIARNHPEIADMLLESSPELAQYRRCGRDRALSALALARRLGHTAIVEHLRAAQAR